MSGMRVLLLAVCLTVVAATGAAAQPATPQPPAFAKGDAAIGKALSDKDCVECHERRFGDADTIYSRADRKVRTPEQLLQQVRYCSAQVGSNYFPEEDEHVAAYLNLQYYKFRP
jgi:cytochrome c553